MNYSICSLWLLTAVAGQVIIEPNSDTLWNTGDQVPITWTSGNKTYPFVDINLMVGPGSGVVVMPIAESLSTATNDTDNNAQLALSYGWQVDDSLSTRNDYFVRISTGNLTVISSSERFVIESPVEGQSNSAVVGAKLAALLWTVLLITLFFP